MPLRWPEVNSKLKPGKYTIKNAIRRLKKVKADPAIAVLTKEVDILQVLDCLSERYESEQRL
jgi:DNA primase